MPYTKNDHFRAVMDPTDDLETSELLALAATGAAAATGTTATTATSPVVAPVVADNSADDGEIGNANGQSVGSPLQHQKQQQEGADEGADEGDVEQKRARACLFFLFSLTSVHVKCFFFHDCRRDEDVAVCKQGIGRLFRRRGRGGGVQRL